MIRITVNGEPCELAGPTRLGELVEQATGTAAPEGIAVGLNRSVVARAAWDDVKVDDGDVVEIIAPFAGG